jgi:hypothetical protein
VSNIAWREDQDVAALALLKSKGISLLEIAPTRIAPEWDEITPAAVEAYKKNIAASGFSGRCCCTILVTSFWHCLARTPETSSF